MLNWQCGPGCAEEELNRTECVSLGFESHCFEASDSDEASKNLRKLVENKGIAFAVFFGNSNQKMVEILHRSVEIIHGNHAEHITIIKVSVDEESKDNFDSDVQLTPKKSLSFCVEGNISVQRTTFLRRIANETLELQDLVEIVPELINNWQDVGPDHFNMLDAFYAEPQKYAYTFQNCVFVTSVRGSRLVE